jgi:hypothetical protein
VDKTKLDSVVDDARTIAEAARAVKGVRNVTVSFCGNKGFFFLLNLRYHLFIAGIVLFNMTVASLDDHNALKAILADPGFILFPLIYSFSRFTLK